MASTMRLMMIMLVIILSVSASVQARNFPNNHHSGAAIKVIQITGVVPHARDRFISIIYGDYKYLRSTNVGKPVPSPPPPQASSGPGQLTSALRCPSLEVPAQDQNSDEFVTYS